MSTVRLTRRSDAVVFYSVDVDGQPAGRVEYHLPQAAILRLGDQAWWLADEVQLGLAGTDASLLRRLLASATTPRCFALRADGGEAVLARAQRRWRWRANDNGMDCEVGDARIEVRVLSVFGGSFALRDGDGRVLGQIRVGGFGRVAHATGLPLPLPETAFLLYATHRMFGRDPGTDTTTGDWA